jgi:hypothetical protein
MNKSSQKLADQIAAAQKTLLALESMVAQTQEIIQTTRRVLEDAKAAQAAAPGGNRKKSKTRR